MLHIPYARPIYVCSYSDVAAVGAAVALDVRAGAAGAAAAAADDVLLHWNLFFVLHSTSSEHPSTPSG